MRCVRCKQDKENITKETGICLDCATPLEELYVVKTLAGKPGFFDGKVVELELSTSQYGGYVFGYMKIEGPVRRSGNRTRTTVRIHEEDVVSVEAGKKRLDELVANLVQQGWEVQNG